jgi:CheY-like chemotaxis protein
MQTDSGVADILMVEDQDTDAYLVRWAFKKAGLAHRFIHLLDGQQAVEFFGRQAPYTDRAQFPWPDLVLLDLKMPRLNGFDVLAWLKAHGDVPALDVVVLTSSDLPGDVARARSLGAVDYFVKPATLDGMVQLAMQLHSKWLHITAQT